MTQGIKGEGLLKGQGCKKPHRIIPGTVWWPVTRTVSRTLNWVSGRKRNQVLKHSSWLSAKAEETWLVILANAAQRMTRRKKEEEEDSSIWPRKGKRGRDRSARKWCVVRTGPGVGAHTCDRILLRKKKCKLISRPLGQHSKTLPQQTRPKNWVSVLTWKAGGKRSKFT